MKKWRKLPFPLLSTISCTTNTSKNRRKVRERIWLILILCTAALLAGRSLEAELERTRKAGGQALKLDVESPHKQNLWGTGDKLHVSFGKGWFSKDNNHFIKQKRGCSRCPLRMNYKQTSPASLLPFHPVPNVQIHTQNEWVLPCPSVHSAIFAKSC